MIRTANKNARPLVQSKTAFKGSNTRGLWAYDDKVYIVVSYGMHHPLFIFKDNEWYENSTSYSVSTSKHRSQLHPLCDTIKLKTDCMSKILRGE